MSSWVLDPERLIIEVESRPLLYSKALPDYANKIVKNNAWEDLTKTLSEDWASLTNEEKKSRCKDIQAKWKYLRDNFRREYQAQRNVTSGQGAKKRKKYRYYDALLFLVQHVEDASTSGNYRTQTNVSEQNSENISISISEDTPVAEPSTATATATRKILGKKMKTSFEDAVLKAIDNDASMDEDKTFCLSLVQSLKKMDDDSKMSAKIEILKVIRNFSNKAHNTFIRDSRIPYFSHPNPDFTITDQNQVHIYSDPQQQLTFTQVRPTSSLTVNPTSQTKTINILENRQYRPANNSATQNSRSHSAQSFFTTYNPNICPSPSNTDSTMIQSPISNITSPEEENYLPYDC